MRYSRHYALTVKDFSEEFQVFKSSLPAYFRKSPSFSFSRVPHLRLHAQRMVAAHFLRHGRAAQLMGSYHMFGLQPKMGHAAEAGS